MRLELGSIHVEGLEFGSQTAFHERTLVVEPDEIRALVLEDTHFADVVVDIARPGESVRIIHALDAVEPRWKVSGPGGVFPGFVSPPTTVGDGRTLRLAGVAVVDVGGPVPGEPTQFRERLVDMAGPGAQYSPFGRTLNLVLEFKPNPAFFFGRATEVKEVLVGGPAVQEYRQALTRAGMKVAAHLGRAAQDAPPDQVETFELAPCDPGLLRVVCLYQQLRRPALYGIPVNLPVGTVMHPNEFFDGAFSGQRGDSTTGSTYWDQNHAILQQLCRHHGRDLSFLGCILFGGSSPYREDKERVASAAVRLARLLGAQAAIVLGINGSNYAVELMWAIQKCEQAGIKTTVLYQDVGYGPGDPGFIFALPEADAIVCTGSRDQPVTLPPMPRVIGGYRLLNPDIDARGEITVPMRYLHSATDVQGHGRWTTRFQ